MGKKNPAEMAKQRDVFVTGAAKKHKIPKEKALAVFEIMEKFAQYGFNRSHATSYSLIAYQTAYLKAHYPTEYMAAVLTHNQGDIEKIAFLMEESHQQGLSLLGPDINKSQVNFSTGLHKEIRFGLGAIKGAGEAAVTAIIEARVQKGAFKDIFDFVESIPLKTVTKKTIEALALSGAFDTFKALHRRQYVHDTSGSSFIEKVIRYQNRMQKKRMEALQSLFATTTYSQIKRPEPVDCAPYELLEQLRIEKELVGFYISGHPLDPFKMDVTSFCNVTTQNILAASRKAVTIAGILTASTIKQNSKGNAFALLTLDDYHGSLHFALWGEDYLKHKHLLEVGTLLFLTGNVTTGYGSQERQTFKPQTIHLLEEMREKMAKGVHLTLAQHHINQQLVNELESCIKRYPGKSFLKISIVDHEAQITIPTVSTQYRVDLTNELFELFNELAIDFYLFR